MLVHRKWRRLTLALSALLVGCASGPRVMEGMGRSIWVDRWDYRTAADIERVMATTADAGFSAVMFQVRGNGTVNYPSAVEIWSERFGFRDPGFDPLRVAVESAHRHGLQLHAWVNLLPGWVGAEPPADERQLWRARRTWFLQDRQSRWQQPAAGKYLSLNPCLPEVRVYLTDLCREIATRYDVDGVHLDHIRFPDPEPDGGVALAVDPVSMALFTGATGRRTTDAAAVARWQAGCVTRLVADIGDAVRSARPPAKVTAAVFADPDIAIAKVRQDWPAWCREGYLDAVFPMNYTDDDARFVYQARKAVRAAVGVDVVMGVGLYKLQTTAQVQTQLEQALRLGADGVAVFSYRKHYGTSAEVTASRQQALRRSVDGWAAAPMR